MLSIDNLMNMDNVYISLKLLNTQPSIIDIVYNICLVMIHNSIYIYISLLLAKLEKFNSRNVLENRILQHLLVILVISFKCRNY